MRRFLIAGNWKMHGSQNMAVELISGIVGRLNLIASVEPDFDVLVCPPNPYFATVRAAISDSLIKMGAQNVSAYPQGAHTGEVALEMLAEFSCDYVLLGHSERRQLYGETDVEIAEKFAACVSGNVHIVPILCIGETLGQRRSGATEAVVSRQLDAVLEVTGIDGFANAVIAYEPVWAIGTGETASPDQAQQVHRFIRNKLANLNKTIADKIQILYGGSMKPTNARELLAQSDIDGGLIGGAALDVDSFADICNAAHKLASN